MNAYLAAVDMPPEWRDRALRRVMNDALLHERQVILIGVRPGGRLMLCMDGCASSTPGSLVLVPDLLALECLANGYDTNSTVLVRDDGRSVLIFQTAS